MKILSKLIDSLYARFIDDYIQTSFNHQKLTMTQLSFALICISKSPISIEAKNQIFDKYKIVLKKIALQKSSNFITYFLALKKLQKNETHYACYFSYLQKLYPPYQYQKILTETFLHLINERIKTGKIENFAYLQENIFLFFGKKGIHKILLDEKNYQEDFSLNLHFLNEDYQPKYREHIVHTYSILFEKKELESLIDTPFKARKITKL